MTVGFVFFLTPLYLLMLITRRVGLFVLPTVALLWLMSRWQTNSLPAPTAERRQRSLVHSVRRSAWPLAEQALVSSADCPTMICNREERQQRACRQQAMRPQAVTLWSSSGLAIGDGKTTIQEVILYKEV